MRTVTRTSIHLSFHCVLLFAAFNIAYSRPQLKVVSPDHYLPKGFFAHMVSIGGDGHLVPESFYSGASKINPVPEDAESLHEAALTYTAVTVTTTPKYRLQQQQPSQVDSYTNIGSSNTAGDSSVSNVGDYGETVPEQLSKLEQSSYASYPDTN